jgi:hypothetical protein
MCRARAMRRTTFAARSVSRSAAQARDTPPCHSAAGASGASDGVCNGDELDEVVLREDAAGDVARTCDAVDTLEQALVAVVIDDVELAAGGGWRG